MLEGVLRLPIVGAEAVLLQALLVRDQERHAQHNLRRSTRGTRAEDAPALREEQPELQERQLHAREDAQDAARYLASLQLGAQGRDALPRLRVFPEPERPSRDSEVDRNARV